jgi:Ricin-type beta-trefoil lectin domain-like
VRRKRTLAIVVAFVAAFFASLAVASPADADTGGPTLNYYGGLCLTPQNNNPASSTLIVQMPCDIYTTGVRNLMQEWTAVCNDSNCRSFHYINRGSGLCLRARGTGPARGLQIMLADCTSITDNNWVYRSTSVPGTFGLESRISGSSGYCLDVPGGNLTTVGLALQLWTCNGTAAQVFWAPGGVIE